MPPQSLFPLRNSLVYGPLIPGTTTPEQFPPTGASGTPEPGKVLVETRRGRPGRGARLRLAFWTQQGPGEGGGTCAGTGEGVGD